MPPNNSCIHEMSRLVTVIHNFQNDAISQQSTAHGNDSMTDDAIHAHWRSVCALAKLTSQIAIGCNVAARKGTVSGELPALTTDRPCVAIHVRSDSIRLYIDGFIISACLLWTFAGWVAI